jgi:hypothetical protein
MVVFTLCCLAKKKKKKKEEEEKESLYLLFWEGKKINYFILVNKK